MDLLQKETCLLVFFSGEEKSFDDRLLFSSSLLLLSGFEEEYGDLDDVEESCRRRRMILFNPFSHRLGLLIPNKHERGQHDDSKTNSSVSRKKRGLFLPFASTRSLPRSRAKVYVAGVKERERGRSNDATKQSKVFSQWTENSENKKKCKKRQKISGEKRQKVLFLKESEDKRRRTTENNEKNGTTAPRIKRSSKHSREYH